MKSQSSSGSPEAQAQAGYASGGREACSPAEQSQHRDCSVNNRPSIIFLVPVEGRTRWSR